MPGDPYLYNNDGRPAEKRGVQASAGAADAGKIPALDAAGRLDASMMPVGITAEVVVCTASETLTSGAFVNLYNNAGAINARNADATTNGKPAHGFVLAGVTAGQQATVYLEGNNTGVTGRTPGALQFLSTTPGQPTETAPSTAGNLVQQLGIAVTATAQQFEPREICTKA